MHDICSLTPATMQTVQSTSRNLRRCNGWSQPADWSCMYVESMRYMWLPERIAHLEAQQPHYKLRVDTPILALRNLGSHEGIQIWVWRDLLALLIVPQRAEQSCSRFSSSTGESAGR